jgi:hypothetical protein
MTKYTMIKCPCCSLVGPAYGMQTHVRRCMEAYRLAKKHEQKTETTGAT